jgi:hypothetical protein
MVVVWTTPHFPNSSRQSSENTCFRYRAGFADFLAPSGGLLSQPERRNYA